MPDGGRLDICAHDKRVISGDIPGLEPGDYVAVAVKDTGHGMDEATLVRAPEPFFTTKDRGRGTGLGLSMVDGLVGQSGGIMRITSRLGCGTTIELWLPASRLETDQQQSAMLQVASQRRSYRVLVVDDDPLVRTSTAAMIEELGHAVIEAASGSQALEFVGAGLEIDVVITDYAMPGLNGAALAEKITQSRPGLPIAIATGFADAIGELPSLPRLNKPYRQQELAELIGRLVCQPSPQFQFLPAPSLTAPPASEI